MQRTARQTARPLGLRPAANRKVAARAAVAGPVPDQNKRNIVNLMLVGATGLPTIGLAIPYLAFFVPPTCALFARVGLTAASERRAEMRCFAVSTQQPQAPAAQLSSHARATAQSIQATLPRCVAYLALTLWCARAVALAVVPRLVSVRCFLVHIQPPRHGTLDRPGIFRCSTDLSLRDLSCVMQCTCCCLCSMLALEAAHWQLVAELPPAHMLRWPRQPVAYTLWARAGMSASARPVAPAIQYRARHAEHTSSIALSVQAHLPVML